MNDLLSGFMNPDSRLAEILVVLAIFVIGIFVSKLVARMARKGLTKMGVNERLNSETTKIDFVKTIGNLIYYVLVLNVVLIVLERLGVTSVLDPLKNLAQQFMDALPRIIGASIIFYAGWIIAQLCGSVVEIATVKLDEVIEKKGLNAEFKISKFLSAFVFGGVLIPIVVAGLDFLNIKAISVPATAMIKDFMATVPNIVGAGLILLVSYIIGKFIVFLLTGLLDGMNVNALPEKMGFSSLIPSKMTFSGLVGKVAMFFIMLTASTAAIDKLNIEIVSTIFSRCVDFAGGIVLGGVILLIGNFLANLAHKHLTSVGGSSHTGSVAKFAILGLVVAMGLKAMGLADQIVNMAFGLTLGAIAVSVAISFGVGGIDAARKLTSEWVNKK